MTSFSVNRIARDYVTSLCKLYEGVSFESFQGHFEEDVRDSPRVKELYEEYKRQRRLVRESAIETVNKRYQEERPGLPLLYGQSKTEVVRYMKERSASLKRTIDIEENEISTMITKLKRFDHLLNIDNANANDDDDDEDEDEDDDDDDVDEDDDDDQNNKEVIKKIDNLPDVLKILQ